MLTSFDVEKEVSNMTEQHQVTEFESLEEELADLLDHGSEEEGDLLPKSSSNVACLDGRSFFLVGHTSRFCPINQD